MAIHKYQCIFEHDSALPEDSSVNTLYFETNAPDTVEGTADGIRDAFNGFGLHLSSSLSGKLTIRVWTMDTPAVRILEKNYTIGTGGGAGVAEVAICLSYTGQDDPDLATGRTRGRIFLGPLSSTSTERPSAGLLDAVLDLGEALAQVGTAGNTTWHMFSPTMSAATDDIYAPKIESIFCDNAWDTQRRRGLKPTTREVRDVQ